MSNLQTQVESEQLCKSDADQMRLVIMLVNVWMKTFVFFHNIKEMNIWLENQTQDKTCIRFTDIY